MRLVRDAISDGLTEEEADVIEGGGSDGEATSAVPDDVPLVGTQAAVGELWEEHGHLQYITQSGEFWD